jgi:hypothetical protein
MGDTGKKMLRPKQALKEDTNRLAVESVPRI